MKTFISGAILLTIAMSCNQEVYDQIYMGLILNTLNEKALNHDILSIRNNSIELLRKLCNGQKSTWEGQK